MTVCGRCAAPMVGTPPVCPRCMLDAELPPLVIGDRIELGEEIGGGGMATVFRGRHLGLDRDVAVKVLAPALAADPELRDRFTHEARAMARLDHPRIVRVLDSGTDGDVSYIVMELVGGGDLGHHLPLPPARAIAVAMQVCEGLEAAHQQGIVHRDIKPQNILVDREGDAKIGDFGIAALREADRMTRPGAAVGTPAFMAPEALSGAPPDPRMDVFATGLLLREMVSAPPGTPQPPGLAAVIARATERAPEDRYASAAALRAALAALTEGQAPSAPPGALDTAERTWRSVVALVLTVATAASLYALLASVTPRVLTAEQVAPLTMAHVEPLGDGRFVSRARFETGPMLAALLAVASGFAAFGLLHRHWRQAGLLERRPAQPVPEATTVLVMGVVAFAVFATRRLVLVPLVPGLAVYVPLLGGLLETAALYTLWVALLECGRAGRSPAREPRLVVGVLLFMIPPLFELWSYLTTWAP